MEELRTELNEVIEVAGKINGVHKRVANKVGFTQTYIQNIRRGDGLVKDNQENEDMLKRLILEYRAELREYAKSIKVIL